MRGPLLLLGLGLGLYALSKRSSSSRFTADRPSVTQGHGPKTDVVRRRIGGDPEARLPFVFGRDVFLTLDTPESEPGLRWKLARPANFPAKLHDGAGADTFTFDMPDTPSSLVTLEFHLLAPNSPAPRDVFTLTLVRPEYPILDLAIGETEFERRIPFEPGRRVRVALPKGPEGTSWQSDMTLGRIASHFDGGDASRESFLFTEPDSLGGDGHYFLVAAFKLVDRAGKEQGAALVTLDKTISEQRSDPARRAK